MPWPHTKVLWFICILVCTQEYKRVHAQSCPPYTLLRPWPTPSFCVTSSCPADANNPYSISETNQKYWNDRQGRIPDCEVVF